MDQMIIANVALDIFCILLCLMPILYLTSAHRYKIKLNQYFMGLCISNALTALSGAVVGQMQKTADINGGAGIVVIGLACLIIGETVVGRGSGLRGVIAVIVGSVIYRFIYAVVLKTGIVPIECLKLVTAVIVALAIAMPALKKYFAFQKRKWAASRRKGGR